jgi:hypothetical protein
MPAPPPDLAEAARAAARRQGDPRRAGQPTRHTRLARRLDIDPRRARKDAHDAGRTGVAKDDPGPPEQKPGRQGLRFAAGDERKRERDIHQSAA